MIHEFDTHYWLARTKGGELITMEQYKSSDPIWAEVDYVRIDPLYLFCYQVALEVHRPPGYILLFRIRPHIDLITNKVLFVDYVLGAERGDWPPGIAGGFDMDPDEFLIWHGFNKDNYLPIIDGFRVILDHSGLIDFYSSDNWGFKWEEEGLKQIYKFGLDWPNPLLEPNILVADEVLEGYC